MHDTQSGAFEKWVGGMGTDSYKHQGIHRENSKPWGKTLVGSKLVGSTPQTGSSFFRGAGWEGLKGTPNCGVQADAWRCLWDQMTRTYQVLGSGTVGFICDYLTGQEGQKGSASPRSSEKIKAAR
jgi:hypothetical protein